MAPLADGIPAAAVGMRGLVAKAYALRDTDLVGAGSPAQHPSHGWQSSEIDADSAGPYNPGD